MSFDVFLLNILRHFNIKMKTKPSKIMSCEQMNNIDVIARAFSTKYYMRLDSKNLFYSAVTLLPHTIII